MARQLPPTTARFEVNDSWRAKCVDRGLTPLHWQVRDQGHDHELQPGGRAAAEPTIT
jgi:hypothetical protein